MSCSMYIPIALYIYVLFNSESLDGNTHACLFGLQPTDIQIQNTNNFILNRIKNNKTLPTSYFSMVNMYNIIQLLTYLTGIIYILY